VSLVVCAHVELEFEFHRITSLHSSELQEHSSRRGKEQQTCCWKFGRLIKSSSGSLLLGN